ncbi:MAG: hypoxanthine phosphoribosyltransferase [Bacteroidales bacterium]|nr:hypoxanthine phosphoribosyltransferase [Bacteroidales bacterium]
MQIKVHDKYFKKYISHKKIIEAIEEVAEKINADYQFSEDVPIVLCVLNGSIMFTGELMQRLHFDCELHSIKLSSYSGTQSTGEVKEVLGLNIDIKGRPVIISEDIVDTGITINALSKSLLEKGAKEVKIATLFFKPESYRGGCKIDYVAMDIQNQFIVGFGLDYNQLGRNYGDIYILDEPK